MPLILRCRCRRGPQRTWAPSRLAVPTRPRHQRAVRRPRPPRRSGGLLRAARQRADVLRRSRAASRDEDGRRPTIEPPSKAEQAVCYQGYRSMSRCVANPLPYRHGNEEDRANGHPSRRQSEDHRQPDGHDESREPEGQEAAVMRGAARSVRHVGTVPSGYSRPRRARRAAFGSHRGAVVICVRVAGAGGCRARGLVRFDPPPAPAFFRGEQGPGMPSVTAPEQAVSRQLSTVSREQ